MFQMRFGEVPEKWLYAYAEVLVSQKKLNCNNFIQRFRLLCELCLAITTTFFKWKRSLHGRDIPRYVGSEMPM